MAHKRGFWLSVLFVGQSITIVVLAAFQDQIQQAAVLAVFLPLVISCGGNSGSQIATLITGALALEEVSSNDWWYILRRELVTASILAAALGALGFICVFVFNQVVFGWMGEQTTTHWLRLATTVAVAISGVVIWGTAVGSLLPLFLKRAGMDPAAASSPMVATLMDASGTLIYLGLAVLILTGTIL